MAKNRLLAKIVNHAISSGYIQCCKQPQSAVVAYGAASSGNQQWLHTALQAVAISSRCKQVCNVTVHVASSFAAAAQDNIRPCNA